MVPKQIDAKNSKKYDFPIFFQVSSKSTIFEETWKNMISLYSFRFLQKWYFLTLTFFSFFLFFTWNHPAGLVTGGRRQVACERWQVTCYMWHVKCYTWHMTHDTWHMTHDTFCKRTVINGLHIIGHINPVLLTLPTLQCHWPMTSDNATDQCESPATWLQVHVLRKAGGCVNGLPCLPVGVTGLLKGQLKHFLESQLKHYEARYLESKGTTYNF